MTMMMTNSQFGLEDMVALLRAPSSPMADAVDLLFGPHDEEVALEGEGTSLDGDSSPSSPLTTSSLSSPCFYSPPASPPADLLQGDKAWMESDLLSPPWLGHAGQLRQTVSDDSKEEMFANLDWMAEKVDLSEFDLDTLIGSCSPAEEPPVSPEDLLASLDFPMEPMSTLSTPMVSSLPSAPLPSVPSPPSTLPPLPFVCSEPSTNSADEPESCTQDQDVPSWEAMSIPEPQQELEIKSEPASPEPSCLSVFNPSSPVYSLDLGSEVCVSESEVKPVVASVVPQVSRLVLSLSPTRIVFVLAPKEEVAITTTTIATSEAVRSSPPTKASRCRPYPEPKYKASPESSSIKIKSLQSAAEERPTAKTSKAKKLKKMEQNKTAATRYRQKKKSESTSLLEEHSLLERKNMELTEKAESMAREIEYLKELMEEVRQARTKRSLNADP